MLFSTVVQKTIRQLSQVTGTAVQTYSEDQIADHIQHIYAMVADEEWWPSMMHWHSLTLDGSGYPTMGITADGIGVTDFNNIRAVYPAESNKPLPIIPATINPYLLTGSNMQYVSPDTTYASTYKPLRIWPTGASGDIYVHAMHEVEEFSDNDTINLDYLVLVFGAAYQYSEDDGTNPGATQKFQTLFEKRLNQLRANLSNMELALDPRVGSNIGSWWER